MDSTRLSRRDFLKNAGLGAAFLAGIKFIPASLQNQPSSQMQMGDFMPDAEVNITAAEKYVQILPGAKTRVWSYSGQLLWGNGVTVTNLTGNYLGPILRVKFGTKIRINFYNNLAEKSVIHPHGLRVPEDCDGQPMQAIDPGQLKVYDFQVIDRACPAWFHPHPMGLTAHQVVMGMAGLFTVWDDEEAGIVPGAGTGANDIPVIIQDRSFDSNNQFYYQPNWMWGYLADRILVNGKVNAAFSLEPRGYRLRFLNGSNARTYKLAWSNNMPLKVIGTDGGLLPAPVSRSYVMLMPGERVDIWADFSKLAGSQVILKSLSFDPGGMGGMGGGGRMGGGGGGCNCGGGGMNSAPSNGAAFNIMTVNVGRKATASPVLGTSFPSLSVRYNSG
ncbi:MAG: multicopper oxidase domain-containing protein, partial [Omnitrophica WOR_2 bacterium]